MALESAIGFTPASAMLAQPAGTTGHAAIPANRRLQPFTEPCTATKLPAQEQGDVTPRHEHVDTAPARSVTWPALGPPRRSLSLDPRDCDRPRICVRGAFEGGLRVDELLTA